MSESGDEAATVAASVQRIEIVGERRRTHDAAFRSRVVAEAMTPGARVQEVARRHQLCSSLIYRWRREAAPGVATGSAVRLLAVRVGEPRGVEKSPAKPSAPAASPSRPGGLIEVELGGGVRVRVGSDVSLTALRRVAAALRG